MNTTLRNQGRAVRHRNSWIAVVLISLGIIALAERAYGFDPTTGTLTIDIGDAPTFKITVGADGSVLANGSALPHPQGGNVKAADVKHLVINGGDGANDIDLSEVTDKDFTQMDDLAQPVQVNAGGGADTVQGSEFADTVDAGTGNDTVNGGKGADVVDGGTGEDTINGGEGRDLLEGGGDNDTIDGGDGEDIVDGGTGNDDLNGGRGEDRIFGRDGRDTMYGGDDNDVMDGGKGDDVMFGGTGNDTMKGGEGSNVINGEGGHDTIDGGDEGDILNGGDGMDVIMGFGGADVINGGDDADTIFGMEGEDVIDAGGGADTIYAGPGDDDITAGDGNDQIEAGEGADTINAGNGDDVIKAGGGDDQIDMGEGNDIALIIPGSTNTVIDSGGDDTLDFSEATAGITLDLDLTDQDQTVDAAGNFVHLQGQFEHFTGSAFDDTVAVRALDVPRTIDGGDGTADVLSFSSQGAEVADDGTTLTVAGLEPVTYANFETVNIGDLGGNGGVVCPTATILLMTFCLGGALLSRPRRRD